MVQSSACVAFGVDRGSKDLVMHLRDLKAHDTLLRVCKVGYCSHLPDSESLHDFDTRARISRSNIGRTYAPASHTTHEAGTR